MLRFLKEHNIPVAFTGIGPQPGQTDYTSSVTANNEASGKAEGKFVCQLAKERGGNKVGMLSLPQDRENAQKYLRGAQAAFKEEGCELVQILQTKGLTVREAVDEANDLLTAHPDIKAIYGMYDEAATGAAKVLQTRNLVGKVAVVTADGSPTTVKLLRDGMIQGIFLQEAGGQGIEATQQVYNALTGKPTTKEMPLTEPLVTAKEIDSPRSPGEAQARLSAVCGPVLTQLRISLREQQRGRPTQEPPILGVQHLRPRLRAARNRSHPKVRNCAELPQRLRQLSEVHRTCQADQ